MVNLSYQEVLQWIDKNCEQKIEKEIVVQKRVQPIKPKNSTKAKSVKKL